MTRFSSDWGRRIGLAVALVLVGYSATSRSLGASLAATDSALALAISPNDVKALGELSQQEYAGAANDNVRRARATALATRAVTLDATIVTAVATLGLNAGGDQQSGRAFDLFKYSETLSRRNLVTQLYFIEEAVARGDVKGALRHYDIALRTSDSAPELLFPVLRSAMGESQLRSELAETLRRNPIWAPPFISEASRQGPDFVAVASLFEDLRKRGLALSEEADNAVIASLISKGNVQAARRYYATTHPGADVSALRNGNFSDAAATGSLFDWTMNTDSGISASIDSADREGALTFSAAPTTAGIAAAQVQLLAPGSYLLRTLARGITQPVGSGPYWQLTCADGRVAGKLELGATGDGKKLFTTTVVVPTGCSAQWLRLLIRSVDDVRGVEGEITAVSIVKIDGKGASDR